MLLCISTYNNIQIAVDDHPITTHRNQMVTAEAAHGQDSRQTLATENRQ